MIFGKDRPLDTRPSPAGELQSGPVGAARWHATGSRLARRIWALFSFPRAVLKPLHFSDFVGFGAGWRLDLHDVPLALANQCARDRRSY
jgi:hypothetical protein